MTPHDPNHPVAPLRTAPRAAAPLLTLLLVVPLAGCPSGKPDRAREPDRGAPQGKVTFTSDPTGAAVFTRSNERLGKTPLTLTRDDGTPLRLLLVKDGHKPKPVLAMVEGGRDKTVHTDLPPATGVLLVQSGPLRGGKVLVGGEKRGRLPCEVEVAADKEHHVEVFLDGFSPYRERVTVQAGKREVVNAMLLPTVLGKRPMGWLSVTADAPAWVSLNGERLSQTPLRRVPLPAGRHKVTVTSDATGQEQTRNVTLRKNKETSINVQFSEEKQP